MSKNEFDRQGGISLRPPPRYRTFLLDINGQISRERAVEALNDKEAITVAVGMMDGRAIDLWDGLRFIEHFPKID